MTAADAVDHVVSWEAELTRLRNRCDPIVDDAVAAHLGAHAALSDVRSLILEVVSALATAKSNGHAYRGPLHELLELTHEPCRSTSRPARSGSTGPSSDRRARWDAWPNPGSTSATRSVHSSSGSAPPTTQS
jgi:hypothetical protein